jgi:hypothetical protein
MSRAEAWDRYARVLDGADIANNAGEAKPQVQEQRTMKETVLYGLPKDATERYEEVLLLTNATPELIERVKVLASRDGFHSFRVAEIDLSIAPDFTKILRK